MKRVSGLWAAVAVLALAVPAIAAPTMANTWQEQTTWWESSGGGSLATNGWFITDPTTDTVYYLAGTTVKKYDKATDTWTNLNASAGGTSGFTQTGEMRALVYANGRFYTNSGSNLLYYDIAANSWGSTSPSFDPPFWYTQGGTYNPVEGKFWFLYTASGYQQPVGIAYDTVNKAWAETVVPSSFMPGVTKYWGRINVLNMGDYSFCIDKDNSGDIDSTPAVYILDWTTVSSYPDESGTKYTCPTTLSNGMTSSGSDMNYTQVLTTYDGVVYWAGAVTSGVLVKLEYDGTTVTWTELASYDNSNSDGYRSHSTAAGLGYIFVRDGGEFFQYLIPEPATLGLLAVGGLATALLRRRR